MVLKHPEPETGRVGGDGPERYEPIPDLGGLPAWLWRRVGGRLLIALAVVLVLLFGSKQLPTLARNLGRGVREVRQTVVDVDPRTELRELEPPPADKAPE